ncbi:MAG TPA: hypothetical protein VFA66_07000 [Gaiellaceae bacterium]|nr:hypothetical protein [Gaiellaceae bacterium]
MKAAALAIAAAMAPAAAHAAAPTPVDGVYRFSWTQKELVAAGTSPSFARHNFGVVTITMRGGAFSLRQVPPPNCAGIYSVSGRTLFVRFTHVCTGWIRATWSLSGGRLHLKPIGGSDRGTEIALTGKPWTKVG